MRLPRVIVALAAALTLVLAGCSSTESSGTGKGYNDSDVDFASDMIQHHAQALQMVDYTMGRELDPPVQELTEQIRAAQTPEIETMVDWLRDWGKKVPPTSRDHANAHAEDHGEQPQMDTDMPGMMSAEEMTALEEAPDGEFQEKWLEMMIDHHEGAIEMSRAEVEDGENAKAVALAKRIIKAQEREITRMRQLLEG
jgi:uncharacterized protein (DUF305 family)